MNPRTYDTRTVTFSLPIALVERWDALRAKLKGEDSAAWPSKRQIIIHAIEEDCQRLEEKLK